MIALRVNTPARQWHARLAERLAALRHEVRVEVLPAAPLQRRARQLAGHELVLKAERVIYGLEPSLFSVWRAPTADRQAARADVTIELTSDGAHGPRVVRPVFDGVAGEDALLAVLLNGKAPVISIRTGEEGRDELGTGHPATERPRVLAHALDQVLVRLIGLLVDAVERLHTGDKIPSTQVARVTAGSSSPFAFLYRGVRQAIAHRIGAARGRPDHWRIAMRPLAGASVAALRDWPSQRFVTLLDDPEHFYADPFPFEHGGRTFVFFEVYPYKTKKGVIGVIEVAQGGAVSPPRTVLEPPFHLSYPFVFEHDGAVYMMPEMSEARRVQLFRADPFPDRWVPDRVLIDDAVIGDATLIRHGGLWWIFGTIAGDGGSSWDQLALFHAPDLFGPWTPHARMPALVDAGAARPAGAMWVEDGVLMRVAQDCRTGYGIGLTLCRVDRLDPEGYAQTIVKRLGPPDGFGADGVHTLNRTASLEVIDLRIPHFSRGRR